ncbi:S1C family serine protease [Deinococcus budaensis]|uniref:S1-C subfamily serine protease n=1 Tax=Deinococcus budaensis TaxID=1665626 RepID=A0A7W8GE75_9DEIO|nr:trypsin-like peptidase domain-containing protein [Deinococcus budaensis]MBB5234017.1 S1-C subfamily serine protease [Deinococcus budaensis]
MKATTMILTALLLLTGCQENSAGTGSTGTSSAGTSSAGSGTATETSTGTSSTGAAQPSATPAGSADSQTGAGSGATSAPPASSGSGTAAGGAGTTGTQDPDRLAYDENTISVVENNQEGVVFVTRLDQVGNGSLFSESPLAPQPSPAPGGAEVVTGSGSGFLIDAQGDILTNYHVIQDAANVRVRLHGNEREYEARVVGTAPDYDLALLRAEGLPSGLTPMRLGDSDSLRVGEKAIAMGAPFGLEFTVTQGIVSALERVIPTGVNYIPQNSIQTDAAINPGNSGGPLVNSRGEVIGVNTQILSPAGAATGVGQNAGVGFAIPINVAKSLLPRLRAGEDISVPRIGVVTLNLQALTPSAREALDLPDSGVLVQSVEPGSPAAQAGLRGGQRSQQFPDGTIRLGGDVITEIDGEAVDSVQDLQSVLIGKEPGDQVTLNVERGGQEVERELTLTPPAGR